MKIAVSKHKEDWIKLCYDVAKVIVALGVIGPIVAGKTTAYTVLGGGILFALVFAGIAVYLRERW